MSMREGVRPINPSDWLAAQSVLGPSDPIMQRLEKPLEDESPESSTMEQIVSEEERVLSRVQRTVQDRRAAVAKTVSRDYDAELIALRDQVREARMEDIPPLVEEMEVVALRFIDGERKRWRGGQGLFPETNAKILYIGGVR